jgi:hypothetical protein
MGRQLRVVGAEIKGRRGTSVEGAPVNFSNWVKAQAEKGVSYFP